MSRNTSYPSPTSAQVADGAGPFYHTHQQPQRMPPPEDLELSAQLSREMANNSENHQAPRPELQRVEQQKAPEPKSAQNNYGEHAFPVHGYQQMNQQMPSPQQMIARDPNMTMTPGMSPGSAMRKKAKVSRACDECRRKKIRCEFVGDVPNDAKCSNCTRTGAICQFSRQPQKRGPSKGYIKELADRLQTVEQYVHVPPQMPPLEASHSPHAPHEMEYSRKRTHSVAEGLSPQGIVRDQLNDRHPPPGGWAAQESAAQVHQYGPGYYAQPSQHASYNEQIQMAVNGAHSERGLPQSRTAMSSNEMRHQEGDVHEAVNFQWDEALVDEFYAHIQATLPFVAYQKHVLRASLGKASTEVREAFLKALQAAVRPPPPNAVPDPNTSHIGQEVFDMLTGVRTTKAPEPTYYNLITSLQTAIMMIISIDIAGPASLHAPGPQRGAWFGHANSIAQSLKLYTLKMTTENLDKDTPEAVSRRAWWTLIVIDRWHSAGTATPQQIPDTVAILDMTDELALARPFYHLARLSLVLGHISELYFSPSSSSLAKSTTVAGHFISRLLTGELERFRESVESEFPNMPLVHLAYLHVRLLHTRLTPNFTAAGHDLVNDAKHIAHLLRASGIPISPLTHHCIMIAAITLIEASEIRDARDEALHGLRELHHAIKEMQTLSHRPNHQLDGFWETVTVNGIDKKLDQAQQVQSGNETAIDRGGLQHLADLAVGESENAASKIDKTSDETIKESNGNVDGVDWSLLTKNGYLHGLY